MQINDYADSRFKNLKKVLKTWTKLNRQFFIQSHDAPWWYNERADISVLSAAAWVAGGLALEEFSTKKGRGQSRRSGRCDLYINLRNSEFACEVKRTLITLTKSSSTNLKYIKESLKTACKDAGILGRDEGRRFGVCFAAVCLPKKSALKCDVKLRELQDEIISANFDAIAWSFPREARKLSDDSHSYWQKYLFPGSILVMREA